MTSRTGKPIIIADYDLAWPRRFAEERAMILRACGDDAFVRIEHVGSTSVPGLAAKPIVDIAPGVRDLAAFAPHIKTIEALGYQYVPEFERDGAAGPGMPFRRYFRKDIDGVRAFHMHVVQTDSDFWRDHLRFRNYLRSSPDDARAYADLKRSLADRYNATMLAHGVDVNIGYTGYKTEFIEGVLARATARIDRNRPIFVLDHNPLWPLKFERERQTVAAIAGDLAVAIEHVGSTSVPGLPAKPTVDLAIGVRSMVQARAFTAPLIAAGYAKGIDNFPDWRYFDRGEHHPFENIHLHVVPFGGDRWNRYLLFRDYLRAHDATAAAYAALKRALAAEFGADRLGYVEAKTEFVAEALARAAAVHLR